MEIVLLLDWSLCDALFPTTFTQFFGFFDVVLYFDYTAECVIDYGIFTMLAFAGTLVLICGII